MNGKESILKRAVIYAKSEEREVIQLKDLPDELSKLNKSNLDDVIIETLVAKNFSHSSINETAAELNLSRTLVSENLRGYLFNNLVKTNFDIDLAVVTITKDKDSADKLKSKLQTYLTNIKKDLEKLESKDFDFIKTQFASKYKNLPQKYHFHLDEIIKHLLNS
jgi:biotin operon repressor